jgi:hypothetical protein
LQYAPPLPHSRVSTLSAQPHPSVARATPDLPARGRYGVCCCAATRHAPPLPRRAQKPEARSQKPEAGSGILLVGMLGDLLALDDFELRLAVPAMETGTLNRSAAILMQAGFTSRLAAIKAVQTAQGTFETARDLGVRLKSKRIEELSRDTDWPSSETAEMWCNFRENYAPKAATIWKKYAFNSEVQWSTEGSRVRVGMPIRLLDYAGSYTSVVTADLDLIGTLRQTLNPSRRGLTTATVGPDENHVSIKYFGPDDLSPSRL